MVMNKTSAADVSIQAVSPVSILGAAVSACAKAVTPTPKNRSRNRTMCLARFIKFSPYQKLARKRLSHADLTAVHSESRLHRLIWYGTVPVVGYAARPERYHPGPRMNI